MNVRVNATHVVEGRTFVTDGSRHCPSRWQCEPRGDESYADFVRRHLTEHEIFIGFESFEDAQRNLFVWCFYSCLKFLLENDAITPQHMWESCEFLANWDFHEDDLEMNTPKAERRYMLPPLAHRRPGVVKRQKKHEAPRETLKTTDAFGLCTFEHLHERFVRDNVNFRINVYSSTTKLGKKRYVAAAAKAWGKKTGRLFELFGGTEIYGPEGKKQTRRISLLHTRGAIDRVTGVVQLRWLQDADKSFATHSLMALGADSESTGERSTSPCAMTSAPRTTPTRSRNGSAMKGKSAEFEKQLEHGGWWLWIDTRKNLNDASGEIDRRADARLLPHPSSSRLWICPDCGEVVSTTLPKDGTGKPRVDEAYLQNSASKHSERDFWNELMNEPQDPEKQTFKRDWFRIVKPLNKRRSRSAAGLGALNSDEMARQRVRARARAARPSSGSDLCDELRGSGRP
jgi:hypothetical protein